MAPTLIATLCHILCRLIKPAGQKPNSKTHKLQARDSENSQPTRRSTATQTAGSTEPRWLWNISQKFKKEKVWTFNVLRANSWALFPPRFLKRKKKKKAKEKRSGPGAGCASIYQRRPHPSAAVRYNRHSWYRKWLQDSHFTELTLRLCHHPRLYPVRRRASADLHLAIWRWGGGGRRISSSKFRVQDWNGILFFFFFLSYFLFPHITSSCQIAYYAKPSQELGCAYGG